MVKRLLDKVVVITGATSGIGLEIAKSVSYTHLTLPTKQMV